MRFFHIVVLGLVLSGTVHAAEKQFINSWKNHDEQIMSYDESGLHFRRKIEVDFVSLREYEGRITKPESKPESIEKEIGAALVLYAQENMTILLVTPENIMKGMNTLNEEYVRTMKKCRDDKSWIVVLPQNEWTEIELNPYCRMDYDQDQITINLYWPDASARPLIDIVTNGLSCVPHHLYGWDRKSRKYVLKSRKCTGERSVESYTATNWRLLPLLPPRYQQ